MFDLGISKLTVIGAVALLVIGPEKLPGLARTLGTLVGRAQRYIHDLKSEIGGVAELDELRQMHQTMQQTASQFGRDMHNMATGVRNDITRPFYSTHEVEDIEDATWHRQHPVRPPPLASERKNWRLKRSALPHWYKARNGVRSKALSGAARVARYRPQKPLS